MPDPGVESQPRRPGRQTAVVVIVLGALAIVAAFADERLLVADPDPSAVTAGDVRLARSLLRGAIPPEALAGACIADGSIDPACLADPGPGDERDSIAAEVVPRTCRRERSIAADCIEREMGVDVPEACVEPGGGADVSCVAGAGTLLVLTDRCLVGARLRQDCLTPAGYGVPDDEVSTDLFGGRTGRGSGSGGDGGDGRAGAEGEGVGTRSDQEAEDGVDRLGDLVGGTATVAAVAVLAGLALWLALGLRSLRRGPTPDRPPPGHDAGGQVRHDRVVLAASVDDGTRRLDDGGDDRDAVIAAYVALLDGLDACAQGRRPAETPLEHMERVMSSLDVRPAPLRELTALFEEARFSAHPMSPEHRRRAGSALHEVAADLARVREPVG
ncbi:DUF4129 domain-containing protein [Iamia sp. SCSIO 61187]|uniref:DUF4129 domain-containing protein n=1 Tax=Iamia sp. SCSIO 61187 TaxID=2722752 RepID=UPI001C63138A|nr:DUF4129 domain-containing protein [Iamia sp. SCSIO 61187]QYG91158.1 DUF4129 domain-containing protein [Iamia sp. SCSIO 61187]